MTNAPWPFLFGDWKTSVLWAIAPSEDGSSEQAIPLPDDQVVFALPTSRSISWTCGDRAGNAEPGSIGIFKISAGQPSLLTGVCPGGLLLGMRAGELTRLLEPFRPGLAPEIREMIYGAGRPATLPARPEILSQVIPALREPPVTGVARAFWYESQFKSLLALTCFVQAQGETEFFCSRQKRLARIRVARAKARLGERLDDALDLNRLAAEVGCSASYLSRTFSATTGMTISQYLRKKRIEKAAEMLVTGRFNVSEVAFEVGYQSLSHFSKAFQQVKGCLPSRYEAA